MLSIALLGISPREMKTYFHTKIYTWLFIAVLLVIVKNWIKPKYPSIGEWLNKLGTSIPWSPTKRKKRRGTSLVAQWLRICLPMQGTPVRSLVWEDCTCRGATKPVGHNYWACALEPASHNCWAHVPRACALQQEKPPQWEARAPQWRVAPARCN